jgi:23S rRNA U2552 (ribose-2'-O)-methylase RlmE/FtsJ
MRQIFEKVKFAKPAASRDRSPELYVVGKGRRRDLDLALLKPVA